MRHAHHSGSNDNASPHTQDATLDLKVRTVKHFKSLAAMNAAADPRQRAARGRNHSGCLDA